MINNMIENREYTEAMYHFRSKVNTDLINAAEAYYKIPLTKSDRAALTALSFKNKQWLIEEYTKEIEYAPADLSNIY
jgi:hypothetical protein